MPAGPPMSDDSAVAMVLIGLVLFAVFCLGLDAVLTDVARAIVADWQGLRALLHLS